MKTHLLPLLFFTLGIMSIPAASVEWDFTKLPSIPQTVWSHTDNNARLAVTRDTAITSPQGTGALKAEILEPGGRKNPYDIQLNFTEKIAIVDGKNYRITILCKASQPAKIFASCFSVSAPYTPFGQPNKFTFEVDDTWNERTIEFTGTGAATASQRIPVITLGTQPDGFTLWIAKVKLEEL